MPNNYKDPFKYEEGQQVPQTNTDMTMHQNGNQTVTVPQGYKMNGNNQPSGSGQQVPQTNTDNLMHFNGSQYVIVPPDYKFNKNGNQQPVQPQQNRQSQIMPISEDDYTFTEDEMNKKFPGFSGNGQQSGNGQPLPNPGVHETAHATPAPAPKNDTPNFNTNDAIGSYAKLLKQYDNPEDDAEKQKRYDAAHSTIIGLGDFLRGMANIYYTGRKGATVQKHNDPSVILQQNINRREAEKQRELQNRQAYLLKQYELASQADNKKAEIEARKEIAKIAAGNRKEVADANNQTRKEINDNNLEFKKGEQPSKIAKNEATTDYLKSKTKGQDITNELLPAKIKADIGRANRSNRGSRSGGSSSSSGRGRGGSGKAPKGYDKFTDGAGHVYYFPKGRIEENWATIYDRLRAEKIIKKPAGTYDKEGNYVNPTKAQAIAAIKRTMGTKNWEKVAKDYDGVAAGRSLRISSSDTRNKNGHQGGNGRNPFEL